MIKNLFSKMKKQSVKGDISGFHDNYLNVAIFIILIEI